MALYQQAAHAVVGVAQLNLRELLAAPAHSAAGGSAESGATLKVLDKVASVTGEDGPIGSLRAVLTLEDFGPVQLPEVDASLASLDSTVSTVNEAARTQAAAAAASAAAASAAAEQQSAALALAEAQRQVQADRIRRDAEYQVMWELETWRRAQEAKYRAEWKELAARRMAELEQEWKRHQTSRAHAFASQQRDVAALEKRLREALFDVEKQVRILLCAVLAYGFSA